VFLKALQAIDRYQDRGQMIAWLLQISRTTIIDHYRAASIRTADNIDDLDLGDGGGFEERVTRRIEACRIGALIGELPERQREALTLYFGEDMAQEDIAAAMGTTPGAVRILVHRGVTHLREVA
jgi:RNA polymerase sigma-70 factor, ECF subfamily